jgi:threonine dehydrogenase-like Zn-dependent dehydrogenase
MRVPYADGTLVHVPAGVSVEAAVLLTDNLPTGWWAAERSDPIEGEPAMVVGLGSVGLSAVVALQSLGAHPVFAVDPVESRLALAAELGAISALPGGAEAPADLPAVVEAAGTADAQAFAFRTVGPGGTLSVIAVQTDAGFPFTPMEAYDRNITVRFGRAPVRSVLDRLIPMVEAGSLAIPEQVIVTHPGEPLEDGPELYRQFAGHRPGLVKVLFAS